MATPTPPFELAHRVGSLKEADDPWAMFDRIGESSRAAIDAALGDSWNWRDKVVLDFGAGVGRTLRHFVDEMSAAEFHACDIDAPSVEWLSEHMPAVRSFVNGETPPIDRPDATFDLVYCVSVFTHLLDSWADWLLEMRRVIKPGGVLVASFMGQAESQALAEIPFDEDRVGMFGFSAGRSWDDGGPMVMHSRWWIEEHWGRAFDVARYVGAGEADPLFTHRMVTLSRPATPPPTVAELVRPGDDPREAQALLHNLEFVQRETARLRHDMRWLQARNADVGPQRTR